MSRKEKSKDKKKKSKRESLDAEPGVWMPNIDRDYDEADESDGKEKKKKKDKTKDKDKDKKKNKDKDKDKEKKKKRASSQESGAFWDTPAVSTTADDDWGGFADPPSKGERTNSFDVAGFGDPEPAAAAASIDDLVSFDVSSPAPAPAHTHANADPLFGLFDSTAPVGAVGGSSQAAEALAQKAADPNDFFAQLEQQAVVKKKTDASNFLDGLSLTTNSHPAPQPQPNAAPYQPVNFGSYNTAPPPASSTSNDLLDMFS